MVVAGPEKDGPLAVRPEDLQSKLTVQDSLSTGCLTWNASSRTFLIGALRVL